MMIMVILTCFPLNSTEVWKIVRLVKCLTIFSYKVTVLSYSVNGDTIELAWSQNISWNTSFSEVLNKSPISMQLDKQVG
jgi:hypothetical protein